MPRTSAHSLALALAAFCFSLPLAAQGGAHGKWVYDPAGVATAAFVYDLLPTGFDPTTATDVELEDWGLPPRPVASSAVAYARWVKMVTAKRIHPQLKFTTRHTNPASGVKEGVQTGSLAADTSENWSGFMATDTAGTFTKNNSDVLAAWTVPAIAPASGSCSSATYEALQWVGFDGWTSKDVLQAGTGTNCGNSDFAFFEWYPNNWTEVSLAVGAGDYLEVEVYYTTSSPYGHALLMNLVTQQSVLVGFNPPSGTTLVGDSAEWILERPKVNGAYTDLPNYASMIFTAAQASNGTYSFFPSSVPVGGLAYVNMTCPPWTPSSACTTTTTISNTDATVDGLDTFVVNAEGPAY